MRKDRQTGREVRTGISSGENCGSSRGGGNKNLEGQCERVWWVTLKSSSAFLTFPPDPGSPPTDVYTETRSCTHTDSNTVLSSGYAHSKIESPTQSQLNIHIYAHRHRYTYIVNYANTLRYTV